MNDLVTNAPELSVSELAGALKRTIEDAFGQVRLRGEISGYRGPHGSGHVYFSLKDQNARIDAVIWKGVFGRLRFVPEDGLEVIATGKITTFAGKSSYQIIIEQMEPAGIGALMALLEARRRQLASEGLFDAARKKTLPYLPTVIGVVTSPTGAVIRDVLHRISDRFPRRVLVWPVKVQGDGSSEAVAAAIRGFNALPAEGAVPRPDVLIIARGGGSLEDLWSFNEEIVVRAAAASKIPLVSAIGHETDWTLLDQVADIRAPTPSAAAEMVVPVRAQLLVQLRERESRLAGAITRLRERDRRELAGLVRALPTGASLLDQPRQRLDLAAFKANSALAARLGRLGLALSTLSRRLSAQTPEARLARIGERLAGLGARLPGLAVRARQQRAERLSDLSARLKRAMASRQQLALRDLVAARAQTDTLMQRARQSMAQRLARGRERLQGRASLLAALDYRQVLTRGYAIIRDETGMPLRLAASIAPRQALEIEFADGRVRALAEPESGLPASKAPKGPAAGRTPPGDKQGSLF